MQSHSYGPLAGPSVRLFARWQQAERPSEEAPIREDLVAEIRRQIAEGTYETPEKLEIALARLLDRLHDE